LVFIISLVLFLAAAQSEAEFTITFQVSSASMPDSAPVCVVGNIEALGKWDHSGALVLERDEDGSWKDVVVLSGEQDVGFKITRGSWDREALDPDGAVPADSWIHLTADTLVAISVSQWKDELASLRGGVIGEVVYHSDFFSEIMGIGRDVWVLLPRSYDSDGARRFPVLYMNDGRNAFDPMLSFSGVDWQVDEVVDSLSKTGAMAEIIVVAVDNTRRRNFEYADTTLGKLYSKFIVEELKPFIDEKYRTFPGRSNTAVVGSSMGGLSSFLLSWWYPKVFGQAGCISPAFLWGGGKILDRVSTEDVSSPRPRLFLSVGDRGLENELSAGVIRMCDLLQNRGWQQGVDLVCRVVEGAEHHERDWAKILVELLPFLFPNKTPQQ